MNTIADVRIPTEEFPLRDFVKGISRGEINIGFLTSTESDRILAIGWIATTDFSKVDAAFSADPSIRNYTVLSEHDESRLYRMEWVTRVGTLSHLLTTENSTILNLVGDKSEWRLHVLFSEWDELLSLYAFCRDRGLHLDFRRLYELNEATQRGEYGLTALQKEALIRAVEFGYFDIPRRLTMDELANELGITRQAVSERLRRGHNRLIESALILGQDGAGLTPLRF